MSGKIDRAELAGKIFTLLQDCKPDEHGVIKPNFRQLGEKLRAPRRTIAPCVSFLVDSGCLDRVHPGQYTLTGEPYEPSVTHRVIKLLEPRSRAIVRAPVHLGNWTTASGLEATTARVDEVLHRNGHVRFVPVSLARMHFLERPMP
jgi:hypothetical protein